MANITPQVRSNYQNGCTNMFLDSLVEPNWQIMPNINDVLMDMIQNVLDRIL